MIWIFILIVTDVKNNRQKDAKQDNLISFLRSMFYSILQKYSTMYRTALHVLYHTEITFYTLFTKEE